MLPTPCLYLKKTRDGEVWDTCSNYISALDSVFFYLAIASIESLPPIPQCCSYSSLHCKQTVGFLPGCSGMIQIQYVTIYTGLPDLRYENIAIQWEQRDIATIYCSGHPDFYSPDLAVLNKASSKRRKSKNVIQPHHIILGLLSGKTCACISVHVASFPHKSSI